MPKKNRSERRIKENKDVLTVLGIDVGTKNLAHAVVKRTEDRWQVLEGALAAPGITNLKFDAEKKDIYSRATKTKPRAKIGVEELKPFRVQARKLIKWLDGVIKEHNPSVFVIERFQTRAAMGRNAIFQGSLSETCSVMVGLMTAHALRRGLTVVLVTAVEWKNKFQHDVQKLDNEKGSPGFYKKFRCPNHIVDAALLAMYGGERSTGRTKKDFKPYDGFHIDWMRKLILDYEK